MTWLTWALGAAGNSKGWIIFGMITSFFGNPLGFFGYLFLLIGHKKSTNIPMNTVYVHDQSNDQTSTQTNANQAMGTKEKKEDVDSSGIKKSVKKGLFTVKEALVSSGAVIIAKLKSTEVDGKQKNLITKIIVGILVLIIIILCSRFIYKNFIGFTEVDLKDDVILVYDTDEFAVSPQIYTNWNYYNENGYYDDEIAYLVDTGIYTQEEAEAFIPDYDLDVANAMSMVFQEFDLSTNKSLSNGDTLEVTFNYDENLAKQNKLKVINNSIDFKIDGLKEPIKSEQITADVLAQTDYTSDDAIELAKSLVPRFDEDDGDTLEVVSSKVYFKPDSDEFPHAELVQVFEISYDDKEDKYTNNSGNYIVTNTADLINADPISVDQITMRDTYNNYNTMDEMITGYLQDGYTEIIF